MEVAAARGVDRVREVSFDGGGLDDLVRVELGDGLHQRLRVGMQRLLEELGGRRLLDDLAEVHDDDAPAHVADDAEVVRDEEIGQVELLLQLDEQVEHLRLDGDVEGGHRLVGDDELGADGESAGDADALALAAAELPRPAIGQLGARARRARAVRPPVLRAPRAGTAGGP